MWRKAQVERTPSTTSNRQRIQTNGNERTGTRTTDKEREIEREPQERSNFKGQTHTHIVMAKWREVDLAVAHRALRQQQQRKKEYGQGRQAAPVDQPGPDMKLLQI
jgi:hypothetical protein